MKCQVCGGDGEFCPDLLFEDVFVLYFYLQELFSVEKVVFLLKSVSPNLTLYTQLIWEMPDNVYLYR